MKDLAARNITISEREIGYLGKKFVIYLALAHRESYRQLRDVMKNRGGYILHVDGTLEFYFRLKEIHRLLQSTIKICLRNKSKDNRVMMNVWELLDEVLIRVLSQS